MSEEEAQAKAHRGKPVKAWLFAAALFVVGVQLLRSH
jgi:hypothetical protein